MLINTYEAAATLTVGTDAFRNERKRVSSRPRVMTGIAIVGANAINEAAVDFYIEDHFVGQFRNSRSGVAQVIESEDVIPVGALNVPPGSQLSAQIAVAPTVNPLIIHVYGQEM